MTSLPLWFRVKNAVVEKHQLEGTDTSARYFNRLLPIKRVEGGYSGSIMYEALIIDSSVHRTVQGAISEIVGKLHTFGFTKIRTRPNFKGQKYLAEKETWVEYSDT